MERRRQLMEQQEIKMARRQCVLELKRQKGIGGGQILLAYGLNKNLKQLGMVGMDGHRASSAKPTKASKLKKNQSNKERLGWKYKGDAYSKWEPKKLQNEFIQD